MLGGRDTAVRASVGTDGGAGKLSGADRITVVGRGDGGARPEGFGDGGGGGGAAGCGSATWCVAEAGALNCKGWGSGVPEPGRGEGCRVEGGAASGGTPTPTTAPLPRGDLRAGAGLVLLGRVTPAFASRAIARAACMSPELTSAEGRVPISRVPWSELRDSVSGACASVCSVAGGGGDTGGGGGGGEVGRELALVIMLSAEGPRVPPPLRLGRDCVPRSVS